MWRSITRAAVLVGFVSLPAPSLPGKAPMSAPPHYLRVSIARWNISLYSDEAQRIFTQIETEGVAVFRAQPGFIRYRLMRADSTTTIAVAEWETEALGQAGAQRYRDWMRRVGIMDKFALETHAGEIVAGS